MSASVRPGDDSRLTRHLLDEQTGDGLKRRLLLRFRDSFRLVVVFCVPRKALVELRGVAVHLDYSHG